MEAMQALRRYAAEPSSSQSVPDLVCPPLVATRTSPSPAAYSLSALAISRSLAPKSSSLIE